MITILKETTNWVKAPNTPNHIYLINEKDKLVAYIKTGTNDLIIHSKPTSFSKSYRKFQVLDTVNSLEDLM